MSGDRPSKRAGRRPGRRGSKMDVRSKLERSRQSARECRARKKLRYQYLEDLVANREKAVFALRDELELRKQWCIKVDDGFLPFALQQLIKMLEAIDVNDPSPQNYTELDVTTVSSDSEESDEVVDDISESRDVQKVPTQFMLSDIGSKDDVRDDVFKVPVLKKFRIDNGNVKTSTPATNQPFQSKYQRTGTGDVNNVFETPDIPLETNILPSGPTYTFRDGATGSAADTDIFATIRMDDFLPEANFSKKSVDSASELMGEVKDVPSLFANIGRSSEMNQNVAVESGMEKPSKFTDHSRREDSQVAKSHLPTIIEEPYC